MAFCQSVDPDPCHDILVTVHGYSERQTHVICFAIHILTINLIIKPLRLFITVNIMICDIFTWSVEYNVCCLFN